MTIAPREALRSGSDKIRLFVLCLFVGTSFLSAALLFSVQPMLTKLVLPILGGSASVWSIAMVFFQATLLLGYAYAHLLARFCLPKLVLPIHVGLSILAILMLPVAVPAGWGASPSSFQSLWLIALFSAAVGAPFLWLSANGPLLQAWYSRSEQPDSDRPYFLYAASNIGSFAALLAYPLVIEPFIALKLQTHIWAFAFACLSGFIALCGLVAYRHVRGEASANVGSDSSTEHGAIGWRDRVAWILLAFVPSGLLVSVTAHISTDIAAVPLLWVVPLALFLLTFVLTFAERGRASVETMSRIQVWAVALSLVSLLQILPIWVGIPINLMAFFFSAMLCHTALYRRRPAAKDLTEFYLLMSLGGCLGGVFCALVAPQIFSTVLEYPLLLVLALMCRPGFFGGAFRRWLWKSGRNAILCGLVILAIGLLGTLILPAETVRFILVVTFAVMLMVNWRVPQWVAPSASAAALAACVIVLGTQTQETVRSFFGVHKLAVTSDGRFLTLAHGTTIHGAIRRLNEDGTVATGRPEPTTYYTYEGGIGSAISSIRNANGGTLESVAAIGLGSGSLACHRKPPETWTFFEIDPEVIEIARDARRFRFLSECAPESRIVVGDARLTIAGEVRPYELVVLDAFSSDAIPAHLLTTEAFQLYRSKMQPNGALLVHISNRNLDLTDIVARAAAEVGLVAYTVEDFPAEDFSERYRSATVVMALAASGADLGAISTDGVWRKVEPDLRRLPWTDDFSNIVEAILDKNGW